MKASDRSVLFGLVILGLLACFWFLLLAPKREHASELEDQVSTLQQEVSQEEQVATLAEQAEKEYAKNYERLVVLGKAAPADGDTPSLLAQLSAQATAAGTTFGSLTVAEAGDAPPPPAAAETTTDQNAEEGVPTSETPAEPAVPAVPAAPTEAAAATLPLGATVGPAGLGVLPYSLRFTGSFFQIADLLERIDKQVGVDGHGAEVDGRLLTINGFTMAREAETGDLAVELSISTYVLPSSQGLTAGATPTSPAASVPAPTPVSTTTSTTP
jgi:Tfp pilus assembly protein PilO